MKESTEEKKQIIINEYMQDDKYHMFSTKKDIR